MDGGDRREADLHMEYLCTCITQHTPGRLVPPCPPLHIRRPSQGREKGTLSWLCVIAVLWCCPRRDAIISRLPLCDAVFPSLTRAGACSTTLWGGTSRRPGQRLPCVGRWCTDAWWTEGKYVPGEVSRWRSLCCPPRSWEPEFYKWVGRETQPGSQHVPSKGEKGLQRLWFMPASQCPVAPGTPSTPSLLWSKTPWQGSARAS